MGRMHRQKGQRGEREVVKLLQSVVDRVCETVETERILLQRNLLQSHSGGCDLYGLEWLALEVKRQERATVSVWWRQTLRQARAGQTPVLLWRANHRPWQVRMRGAITCGKRSRITCTMDISLEAFLVYFESRLRQELLTNS